MTNAFIAGVAGEALSPAEASFFRAASPAGLILFARNCVAHDQIRRLIGDVREAVRAKTGIELQTEVKFWGFEAGAIGR